MARVIIEPPASKFKFIELINLVNQYYRQYVEIDLLNISILSTYYDQQLMKLIHNFIWFDKDNSQRRKEFLTFLGASNAASKAKQLDTKGNKIELLLSVMWRKKYIQNEIAKKI